MKRLYLGGISAMKDEGDKTRVKFRPALRLEEDKLDEASKRLLFDCYEQFPEEDGWYEQEVSIAEVSSEFLSSLKSYLNGRKDL